ncbi:AraC family transcriptional regulator [Actibacterium lipolyticum]|uniref:HTH-type transcriptional activator Btr n=1 Tax=Actibacterium lipolyticum TaxID=1524263 RepID=A0A238KSY5_9RHOB|nr:AraC family transcriptional regulator [Actibacterium lipolyticum]SMX45933.1 HTH-type transcriptional activator Btr [Actibacterium lipolyticum]
MKTNYAALQEEREALHSRTIRVRFPDTFATLLFLKEGTLRLDESDTEIDGVALCYWPHEKRPNLQLSAGSQAQLLGLSDTIILDAIGARAESVHLRMLAEQPFLAPLKEPASVEQIDALLGWFTDELTDPNRQSPMSLSAYLRLLFINALRVHRPEPLEKGAEQTSILRRFRHLVELHYRDHWQVSKYAAALGIDYDRLHRICKRETGRSAAELVHERLTAEAKARLENSGYPLKKIAADLGFSDATRFSHFFKRRTDLSPGAYRAVVSRPGNEDLLELRRGFSDWP